MCEAKGRRAQRPLAIGIGAREGVASFFQIPGTTRLHAVSRKIAEARQTFSGVFWIRPLVGVHGCPSRVKDPR